MESETGSGSALGDRNFTYTSYDMVETITRSNKKVEFKYGPDRSRWQRVDSVVGSNTAKPQSILAMLSELKKQRGLY